MGKTIQIATGVLAMLSAARSQKGGVLDSVWVDRQAALREITELQASADVVEVFCVGFGAGRLGLPSYDPDRVRELGRA